MSSPEHILQRVQAVAADLKLDNLQPLIAACRNQARARSGIDVAVLGRFKAGKSSLLNHLVGRAILPVGVVPLTTSITRLRYGEVERAEVRFLDGAVKAVSLPEIALYAGENENPNNEKQVASIEVELPELKALAPLQFVDTPGLDSVLAHNTVVALNWLPNVGAALLAVSADAPLSERDLALLAELRSHTPKIALLLTKADLLSEPQRVEVMNFLREQLRRVNQDQWPVFLHSVKPGLAEMTSMLMEQFLLPLRQDGYEASGQILRHKMASLRKQTLSYLSVALAAATQAESARQELRARLDEERHNFGLFRAELEVLTRQLAARAFDQSLEHLLPIQRELQRTITDELRSHFGQWRGSLPALLRAWRDFVQGFLVRELGEVSHGQQAMFCEPVKMATMHLARCVRAFHDRLAKHVQAALGVTSAPSVFGLDVCEASKPPVDVSYAFDAAFEIVSHVMPGWLFRSSVERRLLGKARYEVEKNVSRLAAGWNERVGMVIEQLRKQAEQAAQNELDSLEWMAEQSVSTVERLREHVVELDRSA